jgi:hypothetical protein
LPQAEALLPERQVWLASQQPLQELLGQVPPQPSSAPMHFPAQSGRHLQVPALQTRLRAEQSTHAAPPMPQAAVEDPFWQVLLPSQQPLQVFVGQGLPQPSSAPRHLPVQEGIHLQIPPEKQDSPLAQATQDPPPVPQAAVVVPFWQELLLSQQPVQVLVGQGLPQPSSCPWHLSVQYGVQPPVQLPLLQVCPLRVQSRQDSAAEPHSSSWVPRKHSPS